MGKNGESILGLAIFPIGSPLAPPTVNSCVKRFGADLKVPSMIQLSESTMASALHSVPHRKDLLVVSWYLESHSIMDFLSVSYHITQTLSTLHSHNTIEPTGYLIMSASVYYVGSRVNQ